MPFTERDTPAIRARIQSDLDLITGTVSTADPHLIALALTGGFSRGEGSVRDGRPLNDYDVVAIRRLPGGAALYAKLQRDLSALIGIEVDISPIARARLPRVAPRLFWLDFRLGARAIHGDADVLARVRRIGARDVPPLEGARLLANRAAGLLLSLGGEGDGRRAKGEPVLDPTIQGAKAVIAAMDASLLARGEYAPTMRERLALSAGHPDAALFARAVDWKLRTHGAPIGWSEARDALLRAVDATSARNVRDGWAERAVYLLRAGRVGLDPSRRVRLRAWALLAGPQDWPRVRTGFVRERGLTLQ